MPNETQILLGAGALWLVIHISGNWLDRYWIYRRGLVFWTSLAAIATPADPFSIAVVGGPLLCLHIAFTWAYHFWRRAQPFC